MTDDELRAIRQRSDYWAVGGTTSAAMAAADRAKLLDEIDRLRAELTWSREAYDSVCRSIGSYVRDADRHAFVRIPEPGEAARQDAEARSIGVGRTIPTPEPGDE